MTQIDTKKIVESLHRTRLVIDMLTKNKVKKIAKLECLRLVASDLSAELKLLNEDFNQDDFIRSIIN